MSSIDNSTITGGDLGGGSFMTTDDVRGGAKAATIRAFTREKVGDEDDAPLKTICHFEGDLKPMVCGKIVLGQIRAVTQADTPQDAIGKTVELYLDPTVTYMGKVTGGIRIREVR